MNAYRAVVVFTGRVLKPKSVGLLLLGGLLVLTQSSGNAQTPGALKFFKNFFVTGDYIVAGVGLEGLGDGSGLATANINLGQPGDPGAIAVEDVGAEVLGAFLYFQVVSSSGSDAGALTATFNGQLLSTPPQLPSQEAGPIAVVGDPFGTSPCWSSGGGTGSGGTKKTFTYRADVLRFLDIDENTGKHRIHGEYQVQLPDQGNANNTPLALGASLAVFYRRPNPSPVQPLNAIVIYDGSYTVNNATPSMSQTIQGFYDPANVGGKITHIVAAGQLNKTDRLLAPGVNETNVFTSANGLSWDTVTRNTTSLAGATSFTTTVDWGGSSNGDCLTWGAVIYRTEVKDDDGDGLLNRWESSQGLPQGESYPLKDPYGEPLPNLAAMGAHSNNPDLFIEIGYMHTGSANYTYGGVQKLAHSHKPLYAALEKVGDAFAEQGIDVHFDIGNNYQNQDYIIKVADGAQGGDELNESVTQCTPLIPNDAPWTPDKPWLCHYENHPGTVGWKTGYRFIRDEPPQNVSYAQCHTLETDGVVNTTCARRFRSNRRDMFHYAWFAHALGIPKVSCIVTFNPNAATTEDPVDTADPNDPDIGYPDVICQQTNALYHVPVSNTGIGDFPGGDLMVTLGAFDNEASLPIGTEYMQAATLMHELGHNFSLRHGAFAESSTSILPEPNCKPNYLSIMNYLFQLRGLTTTANGDPQVGYSDSVLGDLTESTLADGALAGALFRTGWYAPASVIPPFATAATKHCNGTPKLPADPSMFRTDAATPGETINWDLGTATTSPYAQDINFDGQIGNSPATTLHGFHDWSHIRLNQVASRRNVGAWYWVETEDAMSGFAAFFGPLSLNVGNGDLGNGDLGNGDLGNGDLGNGDLGNGDLGNGDLGNGDLGNGDLGNGDLGNGDLGNGDLGFGLGNGDLGNGDLGNGDLGNGKEFELNLNVVEANGFAPVRNLTATTKGNSVILTWNRSLLASETQYRIYRWPVGTPPPTTQLPGSPVTVMAGQTAYSFTDIGVPTGMHRYAVVAVFTGDTGDKTIPAFVDISRGGPTK